MKYLHKFEENNTSELKVGDYVYPKPEYSGRFNVLKPIAHRINKIKNKFGTTYCSLDEDEYEEGISINQFPVSYFTKETKRQKLEREMKMGKYNI